MHTGQRLPVDDAEPIANGRYSDFCFPRWTPHHSFAPPTAIAVHREGLRPLTERLLRGAGLGCFVPGLLQPQGDEVEKKIHHILETMGLKDRDRRRAVYEGYRLLGIQQCTRGRLKGLVFEDHNGGAVVPLPPEDTAEREQEKRTGFPAPEAARAPMGILEDFGASPSNLPQKLLACRICITADAVNVDPDIFNSVHGNGLVYDGRLIVDHHFGTTDPGIYGAGSLCEFSRRFQRQNSCAWQCCSL
ncbi:unnamed protein product [Durusdinium trenchii]|uniref:Uncharacterized protein n=1 Tax=Durusdinium trenchii TaxID=1381693 RepID=A0ABP0J148_9DINO